MSGPRLSSADIVQFGSEYKLQNLHQSAPGGDFIYSSEAFRGSKSDIFPHFQESDSSDEDMASFIDNHRRSMSIQRERESILRRRDK